MSRQVLNLKNGIDFTKNPMFFPKEGLNIQRYDVYKYKRFLDIYEQQLGFFWRPQEIDIQKDKADFNSLAPHEQEIFTNNLYYQIILDSVQSRGIGHLIQEIGLPELEAACMAWQFFEQIHSYSYTWIIRNIYPNPTKMFNGILDNDEIMKRATSVTTQYDNLINSLSDDDDYEKRKKLYLTLISINILEGIRFYVSFACSYAFAENKKMIGNASIIKLINRDENLHLGLTQNIIKYLQKNEDEQFQKVVKDCEPLVYKMYEDATNEEIEWAKYIFRNGSLMGLNEGMTCGYMKYQTNRRMKALGLTPMYPNAANPIPWIDGWTGGKEVQVAAQETEIEAYKVGAFKQDSDEVDFSKFSI